MTKSVAKSEKVVTQELSGETSEEKNHSTENDEFVVPDCTKFRTPQKLHSA